MNILYWLPVSLFLLVPDAPGQGLEGPAPEDRPEAGRPLVGGPERLREDWAGLPREIDRSQVYWLQDLEGTTCARGADFKASFDQSGFSFVPFLGSQAPRNFPVTFDLQGVRSGGQELELQSAKMNRNGSLVTWDHGGLSERVEVSPKHMEHSFVIPAGSYANSLSLHLGVQTELQVAPEGQGLLFQNEWGGVRYSGAVAFDESGLRVEFASQWDGQGIVLQVPDWFVQKAQGAIVVDPFTSTFLIDALATADLTAPDLAYDYQGDRYLVAMREQFSGQDFDIYSWLVEGLNGNTISGRYLYNGAIDSGPPSVAFNAQSQAFMTVTGTEDSSTGISQIVGVTSDSLTGAVGSAFLIESSTVATVPVTNPVIGGDHWTAGPSYLCVAWTRVNGSVAGCVYSVVDSTGGTVTGPTLLQPTAVLPDSKLCISKSTGDSGPTSFWQLAWQDSGPGATQINVKSRRIDYLGNFAGPIHNIRTNPLGSVCDHIAVSDLLELGASFAQTSALVTFGWGSTSNTSLWASTVHENSQGVTRQMYNSLDRDTAPQKECVIATTHNHWILVWNLPGDKLYAAVAQPINNQIGFSEGRFLISDPGEPITDIAVCSTGSGGAPAMWVDAMVTWAQGATSPDIHGARISANRDQVAGIQHCWGRYNSSGSGAYMTAIGNRLATETKELRTTHMPTNVFGYYIAGTMGGVIQFPGGSQGYLCVSGVTARFNRVGEIKFSGSTGSFSFEMDPTSIPFANGTAPVMAGQSVNFQTWFRDTVSGSSTSNFSTAVSIPFL